jgi:hypothetical protein
MGIMPVSNTIRCEGDLYPSSTVLPILEHPHPGIVWSKWTSEFLV